MEDVNRLLNNGEAVVFDSTGITNYIITNQGNIYSQNKKTGCLYQRKLRIDRYGYQSIVIKNKCYKPHRLVAENFIPNPNNFPEVHHIKTKEDNSINNLEWVTSTQNKRYYKIDRINKNTIIHYSRELNIIDNRSVEAIRKEKELNNKIKKFNDDIEQLLNEAVHIEIIINKD